MLVWIHKPSKVCRQQASCQDGKILCGQKNKIGLNLQAVADVNKCFLDISNVYPESTSDCHAFEGMDLYTHLECAMLHSNLFLFGDNANVNASCMATPFLSASQLQDTYIFFHSQLRIWVECAFGMFIKRCSILRRIMPRQIIIKKTVALVICLRKLLTFCIDEFDIHEKIYAPNEANIELFGSVPLQTVQHAGHQQMQVQLLDAGNHFDDVTVTGNCRRLRMGRDNAKDPLACHRMSEKVSNLGSWIKIRLLCLRIQTIECCYCIDEFFLFTSQLCFISSDKIVQENFFAVFLGSNSGNLILSICFWKLIETRL